MSRGKARQQGLPLRCLCNCNFLRVEPIWLHHHCRCEEAEANIPCEGEDLPVLQDGLREGRGHKLSAPNHIDVWLWGLEAHHKWWPLP